MKHQFHAQLPRYLVISCYHYLVGLFVKIKSWITFHLLNTPFPPAGLFSIRGAAHAVPSGCCCSCPFILKKRPLSRTGNDENIFFQSNYLEITFSYLEFNMLGVLIYLLQDLFTFGNDNFSVDLFWARLHITK